MMDRGPHLFEQAFLARNEHKSYQMDIDFRRIAAR